MTARPTPKLPPGPITTPSRRGCTHSTRVVVYVCRLGPPSELEESSTGPKLNCDVAAAALWTIQSGEVLFGKVALAPGGREGWGLASGPYHGKGGLFMDRRMFWNKPFGVISTEKGKMAWVTKDARSKMESTDWWACGT